MKISSGSIKAGASSEAYFESIGLKFPEVRKKVITRFCEDKGSALLADIMGTGRTITAKQLADSKKMFIAGNAISWYVETRHRRLVTFKAANTGNGANNTSVAIKLSGNDGYLKAGNTIRLVQASTGTTYILLLTSAGTLNGSDYDYTAKLVTNSAATALPVGLIVNNVQAGWSYTLNSSDCSNDQFTCVPTTFPELFKNFTSTLRVCKDVCKNGVQTVLWIEGDNGSRCYLPTEEAQFYYDVFKSFANGAVYGKATYDANGAILITDQNGLSVGAGSGFLEQIDSTSTVAYQISTYFNTPANYELFRQFLQNQIVAWGLREGIMDGLLYLYVGKGGKMFLQEVLHAYAVTGNCCTMTTFTDNGEQISGPSNNMLYYEFGGYKIVIREEAIFNDVTQNPPLSGLGGATLESFRMIIVPDKTCDSGPVAQLYFRGGCGIEDSFKPTVRPGTINPFGNGMNINVTGKPGYELLIETEYVLVLNNPYGVLHLNPYM